MGPKLPRLTQRRTRRLRRPRQQSRSHLPSSRVLGNALFDQPSQLPRTRGEVHRCNPAATLARARAPKKYSLPRSPPRLNDSRWAQGAPSAPPALLSSSVVPRRPPASPAPPRQRRRNCASASSSSTATPTHASRAYINGRRLRRVTAITLRLGPGNGITKPPDGAPNIATGRMSDDNSRRSRTLDRAADLPRLQKNSNGSPSASTARFLKRLPS